MRVSQHTAPDVDTLFVKGTELLPPAFVLPCSEPYAASG
ncbi:conserved protein of unknown function [Limnospira indica PCC 8005]|uniref:Uncharacterized protein n=1 Tax=Limnospira indica PCC 8005 TaxID=376219 RepID=A0A9P1KCW9_9CYAN|nr:conserved protein of unknown function [Limnospira indica PCC 8005]